MAPEPGIVVVDKPGGMTSHDVVTRMRRIMGTRKVGHAGTLDPMATGVLVIGVEKATKLLGHLSLDRKTYQATIALGRATTTDDAEGDVVSTAPTDAVTDDRIHTEIERLTGDIDQVPAAVSAVKVDGKRAYKRVREGQNVELRPRPVTVHSFDVTGIRRDDGGLSVDAVVAVSSGTYVRALARDLGRALGVGGHLTALRRTVVGPFDLTQARTLERLDEQPSLSLGLDEAVATAFGTHRVDAATARAVGHGQRIDAIGRDGVYALIDGAGKALALASDQGKHVKYLVVLAPA